MILRKVAVQFRTVIPRTGPAATRSSTSCVARRPSACLQCPTRAARLRRWRYSMRSTTRSSGLALDWHVAMITRRVSSTVISGYFFPQPVALRDQEVVREKRERRVVVPSSPGARFVVAEPRLVLPLAMVLFDRPPGVAGAHHGVEGTADPRVGGEELPLPLLVKRLGQEKPPFGAETLVCALKANPQAHRLDDDRAFAGVANVEGRPDALGKHLGDLIDAHEAGPSGTKVGQSLQKADWTTSTRFWQGQPDLGADGQLQDVALPEFVQPVVQRRALPELLVSGEPGMRDPFDPGVANHLEGELPIGTEDDVVRDARGSAARPVRGPGLRKVEAPVEERMPGRAGVRQVAPGHAVVLLAPLAAPLALDADRLVAPLGEGRRIKDEHTVGRPHRLADVAPMLDEHRTLVPGRRGDEVLKEPHVDLLLEGDGLDRFVFQWARQSQQVRREVLALIPARKKPLVSRAELFEGRTTPTEFFVPHGPPLSRRSPTARSPNRP